VRNANENARERCAHSSVTRKMRAISGVCVRVSGRRRGIERHAVKWCAADCLSCPNAQANVEAADNDDYTALVYSAWKGHDACLLQLLEAKVYSCAMRMTAPSEHCVHSSVTRKMRAISSVCVCVCVGRRRDIERHAVG
jgi:hypothetical protein